MRLIDADKLKELIAANVYPVCDVFNSRDYGMFWTGGIEKAIDETPTVDAVEVVRCKDCKHSEKMSSPITAIWCERFGLKDMAVEADDFCSYGEREDE